MKTDTLRPLQHPYNNTWTSLFTFPGLPTNRHRNQRSAHVWPMQNIFLVFCVAVNFIALDFPTCQAVDRLTYLPAPVPFPSAHVALLHAPHGRSGRDTSAVEIRFATSADADETEAKAIAKDRSGWHEDRSECSAKNVRSECSTKNVAKDRSDRNNSSRECLTKNVAKDRSDRNNRSDCCSNITDHNTRSEYAEYNINIDHVNSPRRCTTDRKYSTCTDRSECAECNISDRNVPEEKQQQKANRAVSTHWPTMTVNNHTPSRTVNIRPTNHKLIINKTIRIANSPILHVRDANMKNGNANRRYYRMNENNENACRATVPGVARNNDNFQWVQIGIAIILASTCLRIVTATKHHTSNADRGAARDCNNSNRETRNLRSGLNGRYWRLSENNNEEDTEELEEDQDHEDNTANHDPLVVDGTISVNGTPYTSHYWLRLAVARAAFGTPIAQLIEGPTNDETMMREEWFTNTMLKLAQANIIYHHQYIKEYNRGNINAMMVRGYRLLFNEDITNTRQGEIIINNTLLKYIYEYIHSSNTGYYGYHIDAMDNELLDEEEDHEHGRNLMLLGNMVYRLAIFTERIRPRTWTNMFMRMCRQHRIYSKSELHDIFRSGRLDEVIRSSNHVKMSKLSQYMLFTGRCIDLWKIGDMNTLSFFNVAPVGQPDKCNFNISEDSYGLRRGKPHCGLTPEENMRLADGECMVGMHNRRAFMEISVMNTRVMQQMGARINRVLYILITDNGDEATYKWVGPRYVYWHDQVYYPRKRRYHNIRIEEDLTSLQFDEYGMWSGVEDAASQSGIELCTGGTDHVYQLPMGGVMCNGIHYTSQYWLRLAVHRAMFEYRYEGLDKNQLEDAYTEVLYTLGESSIRSYHDFIRQFTERTIADTKLPIYILNKINKSIQNPETAQSERDLRVEDKELVIPPNESTEHTCLRNSVCRSALFFKRVRPYAWTNRIMKRLITGGITSKIDLTKIYYYNENAGEYRRRSNGPDFNNFELLGIMMCNKIDTRDLEGLSKISYYDVAPTVPRMEILTLTLTQ